MVIPDTVHTDLNDKLDLILYEALLLSLTSAFRLSHPLASLVFVILNEVKNLAHPTDKIGLQGEIEGTVSFVRFACIVPTIRHFIVPGGKYPSLGFVILNEVKNLAHPTDKILRCAQDDKQGAGTGNGEQGAGKDGFT